MTVQSVGVLGLGAMGTLYAAAFMDAGFDVWVIASGSRAERIEREGFVLNGRVYQPVVARPDAAVPLDLVIVGVKQHHLSAVMDDVAPFVGPGTQFISLINGLDSEPDMAARFGWEHVLYCSTVGMTPVREGNRVRSQNMGKLIFGEAHNAPRSERVLRVMAAFDRAGIRHDTPPDMIREMWWKFMANVAVNQVSAVLRMPYRALWASGEAWALMDSLVGEVLALATAADVRLTTADRDDFYRILRTLDPDGKTSMLQDVEAGRPNEVEIFAGKAVALGQQYGVPTPVNATFAHILRALDGTPSHLQEPEQRDGK